MNIYTVASGCNIMFHVSIWCAWERVYEKCAKGKKLDCPKWLAKFHLCSITRKRNFNFGINVFMIMLSGVVVWFVFFFFFLQLFWVFFKLVVEVRNFTILRCKGKY